MVVGSNQLLEVNWVLRKLPWLSLCPSLSEGAWEMKMYRDPKFRRIKIIYRKNTIQGW